ncbi:MAG: SBBP repeat-containing protein, partial [Candidatus Hodarchaeota archaeon]
SFSGAQDVFIAKFSPDGQFLLFFTFFGGSSNDWPTDVAIDASNNILIVGYTVSSDFPVVAAFQSNYTGQEDGFLVKLSADGQTVLFSTYLGGSANDIAWALDIDLDGNVVIVGYTSSNDFPTLNAYQEHFGGTRDAFIAKFRADGQLLFSTYFGGGSDDYGHGVAIDTTGNIVVPGAVITNNLDYQIFVAKFSADGQTQLFLKYFGGDGHDHCNGIAIDFIGNIVISGTTDSSNFFPIVNGSQESYGGGRYDTFITKFSPDGQTMLFSTYLGGSSEDNNYAVAVDTAANILVTGYTSSTNFPTVNATQNTNSGDRDIFVTKFTPGGQISFSTYLGGNSRDQAYDIAADGDGSIIIVGDTISRDFPLVNASQACIGGGSDVFICKFTFNLTNSEASITPSTCIQPTTELSTSTTIIIESTESGAINPSPGFGVPISILGLMIFTILSFIIIKRKKFKIAQFRR